MIFIAAFQELLYTYIKIKMMSIEESYMYMYRYMSLQTSLHRTANLLEIGIS